VFALILAGAAASQSPDAVKAFEVTAGPAVPGKITELRISVTLEKGYHVYSAATKDPYIPTKVVVTAPAGYKVGAPKFPVAKTVTIGSEKLQGYDGTFVITVPVTVPAKAAGKQTLGVKLHYQACNDTACLPPSDRSAFVRFTVKGK
jgi:DsbC/DsbD-like thiol-disulfide interchange protein